MKNSKTHEQLLMNYKDSSIYPEVSNLLSQGFVVVVAYSNDGERFRIVGKCLSKSEAWQRIGSKRNCFIVE
ncbi:hypothetical protein ELBI_63 [Anabaena phage Elbi]|nr:hypothetical protein ELBI_63 [Anabaena phage Elbi]